MRSSMADSANSQNSSNIAMILGFSSNPRRESTDPDQETNSSSDHVVMIGFFNQDMMIPSLKDGPLPASKASLEAMQTIAISQEQGDGECSICLERWKIGEQVKQMPCNHLYHSNCIKKWLEIHGSCPVCRFKMPVDDEENNKQERGTRIERELSEEETRFILFRFLIASNNNPEN